MVAKYLERIGDHATNVAEWVEVLHYGNHPPPTTERPAHRRGADIEKGEGPCLPMRM